MEALDRADIRRGAAARDYRDRLPAREVRRLRAMLDLGMQNVDVAAEMALNRSAVMYHRRLYDAELTAVGQPVTVPVREGRMAGRRLPRGQAERLEALLRKGVPADDAAIAMEVSRPCAVRYRMRIVRELAAKGRTLPGCNAEGRVVGRRSANAVPVDVLADIRRRLAVPERMSAIAATTGVALVTIRRFWKELRPTLDPLPSCPCGKEAHHMRRCRPGTGIDPRADGEALRLLVEGAVPRHHDPALRSDIVQDAIGEILALPRPPADLPALVRRTVSANYRAFADRWGARSLDAPLGDGSDATLLDVLAARSDEDAR
jgi:hypothetical protein